MRYQAAGQHGQAFTSFKGNFKHDLKEGTATLEWVDGSRFHGYFKENLQYYGQYVWPREGDNIPQKEYTGYW